MKTTDNLQKNIELINSLKEKDQEVRGRLSKKGDDTKIFEEMKIIDAHSTKELKRIIAETGFPTNSKYGTQASFNAWLLVQHSPDLEFQKEYLKLLKENIKDVNEVTIAYLEDRILMFEEKPQIYGTQMQTNKETGKLENWTVADPENLNKRRAEIGLEPIEEYLKNFDLS